MNLVLIRGGYPPVAVRPADYAAYVHALQTARLGGGAEDLERFLYERLNATLREASSALREALSAPNSRTPGSDVGGG